MPGQRGPQRGHRVNGNTVWLDWIAERLEVELNAGTSKIKAVASVLKELMELHSDVIFAGDGYSDEWHREAEARGIA